MRAQVKIILEGTALLKGLAGWSEVALNRGLPSPAKLPALYLLLSGECPWTQSTGLI